MTEVDTGHGRITTYRIWHQLTDPEALGLAGAAQILKVETHTQYLRQGRAYKETRDVGYIITSLWADELSVAEMFQATRDHWSIENGQHYRRDRTQDEDRCGTRKARSAQNLSLFRSLAIFLFERQRKRCDAARSLPLYEKRNHRRPRTLLDRFLKSTA